MRKVKAIKGAWTRTLLLGALGAAAALMFSCSPKYPSCKKDKHCRPGEFCINNTCQQCREKGDCADGEECQKGECRKTAGYCKTSSDCAPGQVCRLLRCGPCLSASDCTADQACIDGKCGKAECKVNDDCPAGLSCLERRCKTDESTPLAASLGCALTPIYFEFDSSEVTQEMRASIERNYDCLSKHAGQIKLVGRCDSRGTTEYNLALGERRSRIVGKVLTTIGMEQGKINVSSRGKEDASGTDEASWAKDRRVDFE